MENLKNLTMIQMEYIKLDTLKEEKRIQYLKQLLTVLKTKKYTHDNKITYRYNISKDYTIKSTINTIELYYSNYVETTFTKWKYQQLLDRIENDIYYIEYKHIENKIKELYHNKICSNWITLNQVNSLLYLLDKFHLNTSGNWKKVKDKETNIIYVGYNKSEYIGIKKGNKINYYMNYSKVIDKRELLKNKIDLKEIENKLNTLNQDQFIPFRFLNCKHKLDDNKSYKINLCDRIDNNIDTIKDYFYKNTYNNLINNNEYHYSII